ncbi:MAG TPA: hypothetical protein VGA04_33445 [Streptosporangiaceae bacterium]
MQSPASAIPAQNGGSGAGPHPRSAALGDRWRPAAGLCGTFVPGGQARGGICGQR